MEGLKGFLCVFWKVVLSGDWSNNCFYECDVFDCIGVLVGLMKFEVGFLVVDNEGYIFFDF